MSFAALMGIALAIGIVTILGIALVSYMSSLARSAYELKVEMPRSDDGIRRVEAEMVKQTKWARGDLMSEVERTRAAMLEDLGRRQQDIQAAFTAEIQKREAAWTAERETLSTALTDLDGRVALLEQRLRSRLRPADEPPAEAAATPEPRSADASRLRNPARRTGDRRSRALTGCELEKRGKMGRVIGIEPTNIQYHKLAL